MPGEAHVYFTAFSSGRKALFMFCVKYFTSITISFFQGIYNLKVLLLQYLTHKKRVLCPCSILKTNNQTNNKCLPKFVQTDNAFSSIKKAILGVA